MLEWIEAHAVTMTLAAAVAGSWVRMEIRLGVIANDIAWLKKLAGAGCAEQARRPQRRRKP
jgi:hypothetical protein